MADVGSLRTLPDRELASGVSEVIKYGLIRDAPFFEWLEDNIEKVLERDSEALIETVEASCRNKAEVVALDEKEGGVRATLNLGHTFGHAIETKAGYGTYLHGEAVGIGMHMAAKMSRDLGWISDELFERAVALVARAKVPIVLASGLAARRRVVRVDNGRGQEGRRRLVKADPAQGRPGQLRLHRRIRPGGAEGDAGAAPAIPK